MNNIVEQTIRKAQGVAVVKLYPMVFDRVSLESVIPKFEGKDIEHYIGVFEDGFFDEYYDSKVDSKCYWECDREEFDNLKIGDELDEDTFVVSITRTPDYVYEYNFITESWREI
jgi:hypothetical protein